MQNFWIAFLAGLTTGGLSCLAVQGGLLASTLAQQVEQDISLATSRQGKPKLAGKHYPAAPGHVAQPIVLFLLAKLAAYTLLGILLGALGSVLQLTATIRAVLQFAIGIFMIGNALRMLNVHPIFRYFAFEPPAFVTRYIRRKSKKNVNLVTPLFLGALTVLIPCGVTQAMMALAVSTGSPLQGALILAGFTLGTMPVFFLLAFFTTQLGTRLEKHITLFVSAVLLVLGFVALESGLNLAGSPISLNNFLRSLRSTDAATDIAEVPTFSAFQESAVKLATPDLDEQYAGENKLVVQVLNNGYSPEVATFPADTPFTLILQTQDIHSCSRAFVIPSLKVEEILPATGSVAIEIPAQPAGSTLYYSCSMGMYGGRIEFKG